MPIPVIQGGMGIGVSLSNLASAIANEGGIGVISAVGLGLIQDKQEHSFVDNNDIALRNEIRAARNKTTGILGVNIMTALSNFKELVKTSIEEGIDIVFSGAGLPLDLPSYLGNKSKSKLVPIVSSARAAKIICSKWWQNFKYAPDAIVVEGPKAGGHLGFARKNIDLKEYELEKLIPEVILAKKDVEEQSGKSIPVIAGGGVYTGQDIFNMINLGASAVQMGTRFVASEECDASDKFKQAFIDAKESDISIIDSPVGMPGRAINNAFFNEVKQGLRVSEFCEYNCMKECNSGDNSYCIAKALVHAYNGNLDDGFAFAGSNAYRVKEIFKVSEIFKQLKEEFKLAE